MATRAAKKVSRPRSLQAVVGNKKGADRPIMAASAPLYEQVGYIARQRLIDNVWKPGEALPSEVDLAKELGVSQGTVRKALDDMVAEHLLYRRQGLGTFVSEYTDRRALYLFFNLMAEDGTRVLPENTILSSGPKKATKLESERLRLRANAKVIRIERVRSLKDVPTILETISVPQSLFPGLAHDANLPPHLYRHYQKEYGVTIARAEERVRAVAATNEQAKHLKVDPGTPLLEIERVAVTMDVKPVELRISRCETSNYRFCTERG
jgi:GntR family transcriptional regulator